MSENASLESDVKDNTEPSGEGTENSGKLTAYQKKLFLFLGVATFFEGYDFFALSQILPELRVAWDLPPAASGYIIGVVNIGTILAFWLVRRADIWGRSRVLTITIAGYTLFTALSALAPNVYFFVAAQLITRIFLLAEWSVSMVMAAEEFPAEKRGMTIGVIQASSSLGAVFCAGIVPILVDSPLGWRMVYITGVLPLVLLMFARRGLRETKRFEEAQATGGIKQESLFAIWKSPYRGRMLALALIWFVAYIPAQNGISFWKEFAILERGWTAEEVGGALAIAAVVSMPFVFASGKVIDVLGRRRGAALVFSLSTIGILAAYNLESRAGLTAALVLGVFGASAYLPILNAYASELFPTHLRGTAGAWSNNLLGRLGYVFSPLVVGLIVEQTGAFGPVIGPLSFFSILSIGLIYWLMPETVNQSLESTAVLGGPHTE